MKKRFPAFFLALALCLGLAVPAFATNGGTSPEFYVSMGAENYPFYGTEFQYGQRALNEDRTSYGEVETYESSAWVVPTSKYFYVGVNGLAKDEEDEIFMLAYTDHNGDGVFDQRLFNLDLKKSEIGVLPIPENGTYKVSGPVKPILQAVELPGFDKQENGDYAFNAARLHEFFGNNTWIDFYLTTNKGGSLLGSVLLSAGAFDDVPGIGWYSDPIAWAAEKGITTGTGEGEFSPGEDCTHIQILTFLSRAAGNTKAGNYDWATEQSMVIKWAKEKGMIDDNFNGQKSCTRAEAVNYIWQAKDKPSAQPSNFKDMKGYEQYAKAVDWANEAKVTQGSGGGMFDPGSVCNRAYIATFLYRAYNN